MAELNGLWDYSHHGQAFQRTPQTSGKYSFHFRLIRRLVGVLQRLEETNTFVTVRHV